MVTNVCDDFQALEIPKKKLPRRKKRTKLLPVVKGHKLTIQQWKAFETYLTKYSYKEAARVAGVKYTTVSNWSQSEWWNELQETFMQQKQDEFAMKIAGHYDKLSDALISIWDGTIDDVRLAGTIAKTFETTVKIAKGKVDPLVSSKRDVNIRIEEKKEINVNFVHKVLPYLDQDQAREFALTGNIPEHVLKEIGETIELDENEYEVTDE